MTNLLVIRFSALGDVALLAPVVRAAALQHPDVQITMLSQQRMADLFADMPANVRFLGVDLKKQSLREIVAGLGHYDLVADMHGVWRSLYIRTILRLRGSKVRTIHKGRFSRFLLTRQLSRNALKDTVLRFCDVIQGLGLALSALQAPCKMAGTGIGIAPFAAHKGKIYPLERMEEVVRLLSERTQKEKGSEPIILFGGGKKEQEILDSWCAKYKHVLSTVGKYTLREELELMRGLRVMVTMDSANMHLASLVGTRVVSIWGATHPKAGFMGFGQSAEDCIQRDIPCRPCSIYGKRKCKFGDYRCMDITPEEVVDKVIGDSY